MATWEGSYDLTLGETIIDFVEIRQGTNIIEATFENLMGDVIITPLVGLTPQTVREYPDAAFTNESGQQFGNIILCDFPAGSVMKFKITPNGATGFLKTIETKGHK